MKKVVKPPDSPAKSYFARASRKNSSSTWSLLDDDDYDDEDKQREDVHSPARATAGKFNDDRPLVPVTHLKSRPSFTSVTRKRDHTVPLSNNDRRACTPSLKARILDTDFTPQVPGGYCHTTEEALAAETNASDAMSIRKQSCREMVSQWESKPHSNHRGRTTKDYSLGRIERRINDSQTHPTDKVGNAARQIQRFVRGWWQRLCFRLRLLEKRLKSIEEAHGQIDEIRVSLESQKISYYSEAKTKEAERYESHMMLQGSLAQEAEQVIDYLLSNNRKLLQKIELRRKNIEILRGREKSLSGACRCTHKLQGTMEKRITSVASTHEKLVEVAPLYQKKVAELTEISIQRQELCMVEQRMKALYASGIDEMVRTVEKRCSGFDPSLVSAILEISTSLEDHGINKP